MGDHVWLSPYPLGLPDVATGAGVTLTTRQLETALQAAATSGADRVQIHVRRDGSRMKLYLLAPDSTIPPGDDDITEAFTIAPYGGYE